MASARRLPVSAAAEGVTNRCPFVTLQKHPTCRKIGLKYTSNLHVSVAAGTARYGMGARHARLTLGEAMNALMRSAIILVLSLSACTLLAQSLGEVARENRNTPHPRAKTVVTNDDIPSVDTMKANTADGTKGGRAKQTARRHRCQSAWVGIDQTDEKRSRESDWNAKFSQQQEKSRFWNGNSKCRSKSISKNRSLTWPT